MQVNDLKYSLLDKLISIRDIGLLEKIDNLIGNVDVNKSVFRTTERQKQMLMESEEDIRKGNLISNDDLNVEEDQWLNG